MELKKFNIAIEMKTRTLLGEILGEKTSLKLSNYFGNMPDDSTLLIDITEANVIDYHFCATSIGPLFKSVQNSKYKRKHIIIKIDPDQISNLLAGLSWYLYKERTEADSLTFFKEKNLSIKLLNSQENRIEFIGNIDKLQNQILSIINKKMEISANDIAKTINKTVEETIEKLNGLIKLSFIFKKEKETEVFYCSFNSLFQGGI
jgi:hypothetical protein